MEDTGELQSPGCQPPGGRRMKARAPPPPRHPPTSKVNNEHKLISDVGMPGQSMINMKENLISRTVDFTVTFPSGEEQKESSHGSKAMMDLLVDLCSRRHLNPAHHILELQSRGTQQPLSYKPNTLIGVLDVQKILLKEKVSEEKPKKPPPRIPEKTVLLVVNYLKKQKAVVRVNPEVPLQSIIPAICEKCDVNQEYLVLLRDTFCGEELELTKSLDELGIKELYAWDRKREARISSPIYDATEKEKRRFLGFFKTNKRNREEEYLTTTMDEDYSSEECSKAGSVSEQSFEGETTVPYSPSVNSCCSTLGPSLSLGNISGVMKSTDTKKRRAPPPPILPNQLLNAGGIGQEKVLTQMTQGSSQNDLQKKKRRAPLPPVPIMPERTEEIEDKRKSTTGSLQLSCDSYSMDDVVLEFSEIEETNSGISCLASEDTTEDSGVITPPLDLISLTSPDDSLSSRDKSLSTQGTSPETVSIFAIETGFIRNTSFSSDDIGSIHQSSDGEQTIDVKSEDGDIFIDAQLQETLAELDKDLEAMDSIHDNCEREALPGDMNEAPGLLLQAAEAPLDISLPVPVTIIDEISEDDVTIHQNRDGESLLSQIEVNEDISVQSVSLAEMVSDSGNTGPVKMGKSSCLSISSLQQQLPNEDSICQVEDNQKNKSETQVPSCRGKKQDVVPEIIFKNEDSKDSKEKLAVSDSKFMHEINRKEGKGREMNVEVTKEKLISKTKTELEFRNALAKSPEETDRSLSPSLWCQRVYSGIANYETKTGLTTFKVVPRKPEAKYFEKDATLSTCAIKIDELGNLVTPNAGDLRSIAINDMISSETEETLIERAKEYWKSISMEKLPEESPLTDFTKTVVIKNSQNVNRMSQTRPESMKTLPSLADPIGAENKTVSPKTTLPTPAIQSSPKTHAAPIVNKDKMELPFLKPQRRTSSYYIASAITKRVDLKDSCDKKELNNEKGVKIEKGRPFKSNTIINNTNGPIETQPTKKEEFSGITSCSKNATRTRLLGAHSRNNTVNTEFQDQIRSTSCHHEPHHVTFSKDSGITEEECCCSLIKKIIVREAPSLSHEKKEEVAPCSAPFFLKPSNTLSSSISFNSSVKSTGEDPFNRKSSIDTPTVVYTSSRKDEKHDDVPTKNELESKMKDGTLCHVFGPQKRFKTVTQKPIPKDTTLHSALMEAIQTAGGGEKLRKISSNTRYETQKKPLLTEPVNDRSALLAAIRTYHGTSELRKISSSASEELQRFQKAEVALENREACISEQDPYQTPFRPLLPHPPSSPPSQLTLKSPKVFENKATENPGDARQALMEAIRSGSGAARLRKVPLLV